MGERKLRLATIVAAFCIVVAAHADTPENELAARVRRASADPRMSAYVRLPEDPSSAAVMRLAVLFETIDTTVQFCLARLPETEKAAFTKNYQNWLATQQSLRDEVLLRKRVLFYVASGRDVAKARATLDAAVGLEADMDRWDLLQPDSPRDIYEVFATSPASAPDFSVIYADDVKDMRSSPLPESSPW